MKVHACTVTCTLRSFFFKKTSVHKYSAHMTLHNSLPHFMNIPFCLLLLCELQLDVIPLLHV